MHWISSINWCRRKALTIWQGSLVIGRFPPCDNYLTQRCQLASTWCQSAYKMGDDIYLLGSSSPLVVSIILSVCPSLINRCPPWATKLLTNPTLACRHFSLHMNVAVEVIWSGSATGRIVYTYMTWYQITVHLSVVTSPCKRHSSFCQHFILLVCDWQCTSQRQFVQISSQFPVLSKPQQSPSSPKFDSLQ